VALLENARLSIGYHRHLLRELEALRPDLAKIGTGAPISTISTTAPITPSKPTTQQPPQMAGSRPYTSPPRQNQDLGSKSMFLPAQQGSGGPMAAPPPSMGSRDPLASQSQGQGQGQGMAQSMMLPPHQNGQPRFGQGQAQGQPQGRQQGRRLDERQAAKMLAGGF
jgi:hypothetical protein